MKIRFYVITFVTRRLGVGIVGSLPCLGEWKASQCVYLQPVRLPDKKGLEPSIWTAVVDIPVEEVAGWSFEFKYIRWDLDDRTTTKLEAWDLRDSDTPKSDIYRSSQISENTTCWEGHGSHDNRKFVFTGIHIKTSEEVKTDGNVFMFDKSNFIDDEYVLTPVHFIEPNSALSEYVHTTRFYNSVKEDNNIHFNLVYTKLYCGSTPRHTSHIDLLKEQYGVTAIMNFQTAEDIQNNFPDPDAFPNKDDRDPNYLFDLYERKGLVYVWIPTTDMSTSARSQMVPYAGLILNGLLTKDHCVYVHCNAGVGRSVACCCAYIHFCAGKSIRETNVIINTTRVPAYFDERAMMTGKKLYDKMFGNMKFIVDGK